MCYLIAFDWLQSVVFANFIGAFSVGIYSHVMARKMKTPVTVFLLGGILPLVPGRQIYQMVYYLIAQQNTLSANNLILTLNIAGGDCIGHFSCRYDFYYVEEGTADSRCKGFIKKVPERNMMLSFWYFYLMGSTILHYKKSFIRNQFLCRNKYRLII